MGRGRVRMCLYTKVSLFSDVTIVRPRDGDFMSKKFFCHLFCTHPKLFPLCTTVSSLFLSKMIKKLKG